MPAVSTSVSIRLTEPVVFLIGAVDFERSSARRRATRTPRRTPAGSRAGSRSNSRPPSPPPGLSITHADDHFVPPSPARGQAARAMSPGALAALGGTSRSASRSRITLGTTTGNGTQEENERVDEPPPAMLRGLLTITLAKSSRIRDITVKVKGAARTDWTEGIGPRRLEVLETNLLISQSFTFFSASDQADEMRAASIGPGVTEQSDIGRRGRSGTRSASMLPTMMPTRAPSVGASLIRDDSIFEEADQEIPGAIREQGDNGYPRRPSSLARIPSNTPFEEEEEDSPPPILPGEPSPAYEAASSAAASPSSHLLSTSTNPPSTPTRNEHNDSPTSESRPNSPGGRPLQLSGHQTHARSPLGPAEPTESTSQPPTPTSDRRSFMRSDSSEDTNRSAQIMNGTETIGRVHSNGHSLPEDSATPSTSTASSSRINGNRYIPEQSLEQGLERTTSNLSNVPESSSPRSNSIIPTRRSASNAPPPSARSASSRPSGRFSLGALGDVLRGKSTSRVREGSEAREGRERTQSPDGRSMDRNESRGRKTALKVLRDRLTAGLDGSVVPMTIDSDDEGEVDEESLRRGREISKGWKEFKAGTYTYPISIPIPASLPPTLAADFGNVAYTLKATIHRAGALTTNLTTTSEIVLVACPGQDDTEESESIVVERAWENQLIYHIALSGKSFPIGGTIPISIRLNPLAKIKFFRFTVILEQTVSYYGQNRRLTRHEPAKKFPLLRIENLNMKEPLLPILSESPDVIRDHPLAAFFINPTSSDDTTPSLLDPFGPWRLESNLRLPDCASGLKFSTAHEKANITISHMLKVMLRVQRGDDEFLDSKGNRKLWDVIIETPIHILSCRSSQTNLPAYTAAFSSSSSTASTSLSTTCSHENLPPRPSVTIGPSHVRTSHSPVPVVANVEENLLFARLVAGEITNAGEEPPSYQAVKIGAAIERRTSNSSLMTTRGRDSNRGASSQAGSSPGSGGRASTSRGRSMSVDTLGG